MQEFNKELEEGIDKLYNAVTDKIFKVHQIFIDFYGEAFVDLQNIFSLEEFKSFLSTTSIQGYMSAGAASMSFEDWESFRSRSINALPERLIPGLLSALENRKVFTNIARSHFNEGFILVYFPKVTVTNESDRSIDIFKLFAKVKISYDGSMNSGFTLNKAAYTMAQIRSGYLHSHCPSLGTYDRDCKFSYFASPCTGRGPINGTISYLAREFDADMWNMFCLELSKYVTVESLEGGPYIRLETVGASNTSNNNSCISTYTVVTNYRNYGINSEDLQEFVEYFIGKKLLKFNFINGSFSIGMSLVDYVVAISNSFIEWYNDKFNKKELTQTLSQLLTSGIVKYCIITGGKIYYDRENENNSIYLSHVGKRVCDFKGEEITVEIPDIIDLSENNNKSIILDYPLAMYILNCILKVLNYRYGRENCIHEDNQLGTEVKYI